MEIGSKVLEGQQLGLTGNTGKYKKNGELVNYPAHLHVDAKNANGESIDPEAVNYGRFTNEEFFQTYHGDYRLLLGGNVNSFEEINNLILNRIIVREDVTRLKPVMPPILDAGPADAFHQNLKNKN